MSEAVELHALFSGMVQGVGFRWTVMDYAEKFHLTGTVKNLENGKVEVIAQGPKNALESFVDEVKTDSGSARIDSVNCTYRKPQGLFAGFRIIH